MGGNVRSTPILAFLALTILSSIEVPLLLACASTELPDAVEPPPPLLQAAIAHAPTPATPMAEPVRRRLRRDSARSLVSSAGSGTRCSATCRPSCSIVRTLFCVIEALVAPLVGR